MKKVIITGANGFIGSALCKSLINEGIKVIAVVREPEADISDIANINNLRIVYCDLCDINM